MSRTTTAVERLFRIRERGSSIQTELVAGLTTFVTMAYIIFVNPSIMADAGIPKEAAFVATIYATVLGNLLMGLWVNYPIALAPGMGLNAFFVFTVCGVLEYSYANALLIVLCSGVLFLLLTIVGAREMIVRSVPAAIRIAIPAGIGLFIAFVGMQNAGLVALEASTKVTLVSFNVLNFTTTGAAMIGAAVAVLSLLIIAVLGSIFGGIATPTEAAGVGAFFALILAICYKQFSWKMLYESLMDTAKTTAMVFIILFGAAAFTGVFMSLDGDQIISNWVLGMGIGKWGAFAIMMIIMFILGMFIDWLGIVMIVFPIFLPIMDQFGFDRLWLVAVSATLLQTCFMTPPFGFALFYVKGILPDLFKEGKGVVAQGKLNDKGVFVASEVLAKHDENYMPPEAQEAVDKAHAAMKTLDEKGAKEGSGKATAQTKPAAG